MQTTYAILSNRHGQLERTCRPLGSDFIDVRLDRIGEQLDHHHEIECEAGRYGAFCPFTQDSLNHCLEVVESLIAEIEDQLADWDNT